MTLAEYLDPASAAHASAQAVKASVRAKFRELAGQLPGVPRQAAAVLADQLALVVEGSYASTTALGTDGPAQHARSLAALAIPPRPDILAESAPIGVIGRTQSGPASR